MISELIAALNLQQGDWYIRLADQRDLESYAADTAIKKFFKYANPEEATAKLKRQTAERLFVVLRAAVHSGLLIETKSIQDALGSGETHEALIQVARNAHSAEQAAASAWTKGHKAGYEEAESRYIYPDTTGR